MSRGPKSDRNANKARRQRGASAHFSSLYSGDSFICRLCAGLNHQTDSWGPFFGLATSGQLAKELLVGIATTVDNQNCPGVFEQALLVMRSLADILVWGRWWRKYQDSSAPKDGAGGSDTSVAHQFTHKHAEVSGAHQPDGAVLFWPTDHQDRRLLLPQ